MTTKRSNKSTNVRVQIMGTALQAVARISPALAARWLERLFLKTRRFPLPPRERKWLQSATPSPFESRGKQLAAWTWGESGPTVLLAHGWEGRGSQLGSFVEALIQAGFRVVAFDAPGHGGSPGRASSLVEMADAVLDAAQAFGPLHGVIGHSAGAAATAVALSKRLELERAVFVAPPADLGSFLLHVTQLLGLPLDVATRTRRRIEERFRVSWDELRAEHIAPSMTTPLLVVHDHGDREVRIENAKRLVESWPGARLLTTSELGHRRILRDTSVVADAVAFLLADSEAGRTSYASRAVAASAPVS